MTKTALPLEQASWIATSILGQLAPACERIEIAGSIRRRKPEVGDIELVAVPRIESTVEYDLWGNQVTTTRSLLNARRDELLDEGTLAEHPDDPKRGPRYSKLWIPDAGVQLDLFTASADFSFGLILLLRTGPADYSQRFVTQIKQRRPAHHVAGGELHGGMQCWGTPCTVVPTPEERDVFRATGVPWVEPWDRA